MKDFLFITELETGSIAAEVMKVYSGYGVYFELSGFLIQLR